MRPDADPGPDAPEPRTHRAIAPSGHPDDHAQVSTCDAGNTAESLHPEDASPAPRSAEVPPFPIRDWDRYQAIRFLGQGGMGVVFLARDRMLQREVAIKFVRGDQPERRRRLIAEARAQARVNHENVCRVYEVGEHEGQVFITMQFIDGQPLSQLADTLSVETLALLVRDAAMGLHAAHRAGIIHRDIKPNNILVTSRDDGVRTPYVMDFGIAHDWVDAATATGSVLGTPLYMSPEQARGPVAGLDRRADVYSLGASLYYLLTRLPPIPGAHALEVLTNISTVEPRAPRAVDPNIPVDLEAITLRCLEKDRSARYESARALSEDLDRFLAGEPVVARRAGFLYRAGKRLRKNWRLYGAGAAALVLVLVALGWGLAQRRKTGQRERLVRNFTEQVEHIESLARYSALAPLHDIRGDQDAIRQAMARLDAEIVAAGAQGQGPGRYALGRGHLALGDEAQARVQLELAWQAGYREPRAAYSLALVLGHAYQAELLEIEKIRAAEERAQRKRALEETLRAPALAYLQKSVGANVPSVDYMAALMALYEERYDDALVHLDRMGGGMRWFYEAPALRGAIHLARGSERRNHADRDGALADFAAGRAAYEQAIAVGESVPSVYQELGELEYAGLAMELYGQGDVVPHFERGMAAVERALSALPQHYPSLVLGVQLLRRLAEYRASRGEEVEALLTRAVDLGQRAIAVAPELRPARFALACTWFQWGDHRQQRSLDPEPQLAKALALLDGFGARQRDHDVQLYIGLVHQVRAEHLQQMGGDPRPDLAQAIDAFQVAIQLDPRPISAYTNLGASYSKRASLTGAADPDGDLDKAAEALAAARAIDANHFVPFFEGGQVEIGRAARARDRGRDPQPALQRALVLYEQGIKINPGTPHLSSGKAEALFLMARDAWERGQDPEPLFERAAEAYSAAIRAAPEQPYARANLGEMLTWRARYRIALGGDPLPMLRAAAEAIEAAIERAPDLAFPRSNLALVHAVRARFQLERGHDPGASAAAATAAARQALERGPGESQARLALGIASAVRARGGRQLGAAIRSFEQAEAEFRKAIELAPDELDVRLELAGFYRRWAEWLRSRRQPASTAVARGLAEVDRVLSSHPRRADALLVRAALNAIAAQAGGDPEKAKAAAAELAAALAINPNLRRLATFSPNPPRR